MFDVIHQTVHLNVISRASLGVLVEWIVLPGAARLETILIQFRRTPSRITCNGIPCKFQVRRLTSGANLENVRDLATLERYVEDLSDLRDNGEVVLFLPETLKQTVLLQDACQDQQALAQAVNVGATESVDFAPMTVVFEYTLPLGESAGGLVCLGDQLYVTPAAVDVTCWLPCVDRPVHANTWHFSFAAPPDWTVLCTGTGTPAVDGVWQFDQQTPLRSRSVGFLMGRLARARGGAVEGGDTLSRAVCWTSVVASESTRVRAAAMESTVLPEILTWFRECTQIEMPYRDACHVVFLPRIGMNRWDAGGFGNVMLMEERYLFDANCLDGVYLGTAELANVLARMWWDAMLQLESRACTWILHGLVDWMASLFLKNVFGANHVKYRRLRVSQEVRATDSLPTLTTARPLQWMGYLFSSELNHQLYRDKAGVVMSMLEQLLGAPRFLQMVRQQIIPRHCLHPHSSIETLPVALSIDGLVDMCVGVLNGVSVASALACGSNTAATGSMAPTPATSSGAVAPLLIPAGIDRRKEVVAFFDQWVHCTGYPIAQVQCRYSNKNKTTLVHVTQPDPPAFNPNHLRFYGPIVFRIHELTRTHDQPYILPAPQERLELHARETHPSMAAPPLELASGALQLEYICTSRVRRNRKRKHFEADVLEMLPLDKLLIRHNSTPLLYLRCDPAMTWFSVFLTHQTPIHVLYQLVHEKDVFGQYEAIMNTARLWRETLAPTGKPGERGAKYDLLADGEERMPDDVFAKALYMLVEDVRTYYPIRILAARTIAETCIWSSDNVRFLQFLIRRYREQFFHAKNAEEPLPNDFADLSQYMMRRHLPLAFASARVHINGASVTPDEVVRLLLTCLRHNNNVRNRGLVDGYYVAALIDSLGMISTPDMVLAREVWCEVKRYLDCDPIKPSHNQLVAIACLRCLADLERNHPDVSRQECNFIDYATRVSESAVVRIAAFQSIVKLLPAPSHTKVALTALTHIIRAVTREGLHDLCSRMLKSIWIDLLQQQCPVQVFHAREVQEEAVEWMTTLWNLLLTCIQHDTSLASVTWAVYQLIWGHGVPLFAASTTSTTTAKPISAQAEARRAGARRRALAKHTLQQLRAPRLFKVPKPIPATQTVTQLASVQRPVRPTSPSQVVMIDSVEYL